MGKNSKRLWELRAKVDWRIENLWLQDMEDILSHEKERPQWMKTIDNVRMMIRTRNDEKRLYRPIPESDEVLSFLNIISEQVSDLVVKRDKEAHWDSCLYNGIEGISWQIELKEGFIDTLRWFIQNRKIPENYNFENELVSLKNFDIESLYRFLLEVSERSEEEVKRFILEEIPSYPWDGIESTFGSSQKEAA